MNANGRSQFTFSTSRETSMSVDTDRVDGPVTVTAAPVTVNVEIRKKFQRAMQEDPALQHVMAMIQATNAVSKKWKLELVRGSEENSEWFKTHMTVAPANEVSVYFTLTGPMGTNWENERDACLIALADAAEGSKNQRRNWFIHRVDGNEWKAPTLEQQMIRAERANDGLVTYAEVSYPSDELVKLAFNGAYGIDDQIDRVVNLMRTAIENDFSFRTHAVLLGKPGCGKSYTLELAKKMFFDPDAVLVIDGTAMTSAGVIEILKTITTMPRFIFIEEIDKAEPGSVQVLLGLMDRHGEIRKTTYRDNIQRECRVCVFATANSLAKVQKMQEGALFSRFGGNFITYDRPTDEMLRQILNRELDELGAKGATCTNPKLAKDGKKVANCDKCEECKRRLQWIKITLEWCHKWKGQLVADTLDPRFVIDFCINGRDQLLNNKYLTTYENTSVKADSLEEWD